MRYESSVTSISWIPSEAMSGPLRIPMDLGIGHYDEPPPEHIDPDGLPELRDADRFRFANRLSAWVEVDQGKIVDSGYTGEAWVAKTTVRIGVGSFKVGGISFPLLQAAPVIEAGVARFQQTAGGRTAALPRRVDRPPYLRITAPTAWTTLGLTIAADGTSSFEMSGASPFPRHWIYDADGNVVAKSGLVDFKEWARVHDHGRSPWHDLDHEALITEAESELERQLSVELMAGSPLFRKVAEGIDLVRQGDPSDDLFLILDGMLDVVVDGETVAEVGPGAIVGERSSLEGGVRTATLTATTPVRAAVFFAHEVDKAVRAEMATGHRREASD